MMKKNLFFILLLIPFCGLNHLRAQNLDLTSGEMFALYSKVRLDETYSVDRDGRYIMAPSKGYFTWTVFPYSINEAGDYCIEAEVEQIKNKGKRHSGSSYGIIFGCKDENNFYQLLITDNGYYCFSTYINGILFVIIDWTYSVYINQGNSVNLIKIWKHGDELLIAFNKKLVARPKVEKFYGNNVGVIARSPGKYALRRFKIEQAYNLMP